MEVQSGVPQGSVVRSLMFLDVANELPGWVVNDMLMSADDTEQWARMKRVELKFISADDQVTLLEMIETFSTSICGGFSGCCIWPHLEYCVQIGAWCMSSVFSGKRVARYHAIADYGTTQQSVDMRWPT
jgi:hypothetical protein